MDVLTVATWNVLYRGLDQRTPLLAECIRTVCPDVLLLQETNLVHAHRLADAVGMRVAAVGAGTEGPAADVIPAILSALPVIDAGARPLRLPEARPYVFADVQFEGQQVRCATTHLRHTAQAGRMGADRDLAATSRGERGINEIGDEEIRSSVARRLSELAEIQHVRSQLEPLPEIFGGDLNFVPRSPEYHRILGWGMADAWTDGPRLGSGATIVGVNPLIGDGPLAYDALLTARYPGHVGPIDYTLDYQFHTHRLRADHAWTFGNAIDNVGWPSDHLGLAVEYSLHADR